VAVTANLTLFPDDDDDEPRGPTSDPDVVMPGKVGAGHPDTSRAAARFGAPGFASERARVLLVIAGAEHGCTAAEVASMTGGTRSQSAARMLELREQGWIVRRRDADGQLVKRRTSAVGEGAVHDLAPDADGPLRRWLSDRTRWQAEEGRRNGR
jgi:hypothetical protein